MTRTRQILYHLGLLGLNVGVAYLQGGKVGAINAVVALAQAGVGAQAQLYNTDGTPQEHPFVKPKSKSK